MTQNRVRNGLKKTVRRVVKRNGYNGQTMCGRIEFGLVSCIYDNRTVFMNKEVGVLIGNMVGAMEDVDYGEEGLAWGPNMRITPRHFETS
ncbi:hypothetical protein U1Q18_032992 [Sarracenia purpurea var. burkii]